MKKALVVLIAFALTGGMMFAEDVVASEPTVTISGYGQVTWGVDLDTGATGFKNESEAKLTIPLLTKQSNTKTGEAISGEITLKDLEIDFGTDGNIATGSVAAKILFPSSVYVTVYGNPDFKLNNAQSFAPWVNKDWDDNRGLIKPSFGGTGGIEVGAAMGDLTLAVKVSSVNNYTGSDAVAATSTSVVFVASGAETAVTGVSYFTLAGAVQTLPLTAGVAYIKTTTVAAVAASEGNTTGAYGFELNAGYTVADLLTVSAGAFASVNSDDLIGLTGKVTVNPKDSGLTVVAATDVSIGTVTGIDVLGSVDYSIASIADLGAAVYFGDADLSVDGSQIDVKARVALTAVADLTAKVGVDMWNVTSTADPKSIFAAGEFAYKSALSDTTYVKPFLNVGYALNDANLAVKAGIEAALFPMVTFTAQYAAGAMPGDNTVDKAGANAFDDDLGLFTITAKVSY